MDIFPIVFFFPITFCLCFFSLLKHTSYTRTQSGLNMVIFNKGSLQNTILLTVLMPKDKLMTV